MGSDDFYLGAIVGGVAMAATLLPIIFRLEATLNAILHSSGRKWISMPPPKPSTTQPVDE